MHDYLCMNPLILSAHIDRDIYTTNCIIVYIGFQQWKSEFERSTNSSYAQMCGKKTPLDQSTTYYYCSRSGHFKPKSKGLRLLKSQGSAKINAYCTAAITVNKYQDCGTVSADICSTHHGHEQSLGHLRLSTADRLLIAGQLAQGVKFEHILDKIRDSVNTTRVERIHLTTRKDILNIERAFGIRGIQRHKDDATSLSIWVEEMKSKGQDNPVLRYKPQGKVLEGEYHALTKDDFILVLQTPLQADMLKEFSTIICIDGTHGTNGYSFTLITVLIIDEFGEGFPAAWCIANREDGHLLTIFYKALKERVGNLAPEWFMTDDAGQFYAAWVTTFKNQPHKLLCTWHIDRAWRSNLKKVGNQTLEATLYHNLRVLLEERDVNQFEKLLKATSDDLSQNENTKSFGEYFQTHYVLRKEQWAACYRKGSTINTNMHVEAFHRVLKYLYLKGKVNKRMDNCVHALLKLSRDKGFERLTKLEKGKISTKISMIMKRHKKSLTIPKHYITEEDSIQWKVKSSDGQHEYTVKRENNKCPFNCQVRCSECDICVHQYSCECMDELLHATICKHIHLVHCYQQTSTTMVLSSSAQQENSPGPIDGCTHLERLCNKEYSDLDSIRKRLLDRISIMSGKIHKCCSMDSLLSAEKLIMSASCALSVSLIPSNGKILPPIPANKNIQRQQSFYSTTKRKRKATIRLAKPDKEEKSRINNILLDPDASLYTILSENTISKP